MIRLKAHVLAPLIRLEDVYGKTISFRNGKRTLLIFYRDPACPFSNYNILSLTKKYEELKKLGLEVIAVFSTEVDQVKRFTKAQSIPFPVAVESYCMAYKIYGIEKSFGRKLLTLFRRFVPWLRGMAQMGFTRSVKALGGINTSNYLPADFLIDDYGNIVEAYYGRDAGDHIPSERVYHFAYKGYAQYY